MAVSQNQTLISKQMYDQLKSLPEFANTQVTPYGMGMGLIDKSVMQALNNYRQLDTTKLGDDVFSKALSGKSIKAGENSYIKSSDYDYYSKLNEAVNKSNLGYYGLNELYDPVTTATMGELYGPSTRPAATSMTLNGKSGVYLPYEAATKIQQDKDTDTIQYYRDFLGNDSVFNKGKVVSLPEDVSKSLVDALKTQGKFGTDWQLDNPGLGYFFDYGTFDSEIEGSGPSAYYDVTNTAPNGGINTGKGYHDYSGLAGANIMKMTPEILSQLQEGSMGSISPYLQNSKYFAQSETDPNLFAYQNQDGSWGQAAFDTYTYKKKGGGLIGSVGRALAPAVPLLSFIPGFAQGYAIGNGLTNAAQGRNVGASLFQAGAGALGASGFGDKIAGSIGGSIADKLGSGATSFLGGAKNIGTSVMNTGIGTAGGLAQGQSFGKALQGGAATGLSGLFGGMLNQTLSDVGVGKPITSALTGGASGGLNALFRGRGDAAGQSALLGALSGGIRGTGQQQNWNPQATNGIAKLLTTLAMRQQSQRRG
jgi:hypothetical protein